MIKKPAKEYTKEVGFFLERSFDFAVYLHYPFKFMSLRQQTNR